MLAAFYGDTARLVKGMDPIWQLLGNQEIVHLACLGSGLSAHDHPTKVWANGPR